MEMATNVEYFTLGSLFGLGTSTVFTVVLSTCRAIVKVLSSSLKVIVFTRL